MPTATEAPPLLQQAAALNAENKFADTLTLLSDEVLSESADPQLYLLAADAALKIQPDKAGPYYDNAISLDPHNADAIFKRGSFQLQQGNANAAMADFNQCIALDPGMELAFLTRGNIWYGEKDYQKAFDDYDASLRINPKLALGYINRGLIYSMLGHPDKAGEDYNSAIALDPNAALAYFNRGNLWFNSNRMDEAKKDYDLAIKKDAHLAIAFANRGNAWYNLNQQEEALKDFNTAIALDPQYAAAYMGRANIYYNRGQYDDALKDYEKNIAINAADPLPYYGRGNIFYNRNDFSRAIEDYNKALALNPDFVLAYNNRGLCFLNLKQPDEAMADFQKALSLNPQLSVALNNIGLIHLNNKNYEEAREQFDKVFVLDPGMGLAYFNRGSVFLEMANFTAAITDYTTAIRLMPNYAPAYNKRGLAYEELEKNGVYNQSIQDYRNAVALDPNLSRLLAKIDELLLKNGENPQKAAGEKNVASLFYERVEKIQDPVEKKIIGELSTAFFTAMNNIKDHAHIKKNCPVVHYTKLWVADRIIMDPNDSFLHYSNVAFMNDPEEGKVLRDLLIGKLADKELETYFDSCNLFTPQDPTDSNVYLGSFLPAALADGSDDLLLSHEDDLVMWRTYGKDEKNNEAMGCSLVISSEFFHWPPQGEPFPALQPEFNGNSGNINPLTGISASMDNDSLVLTTAGPSNNGHTISGAPGTYRQEEIHTLYRVLYFNRLTSKIESRADSDNNGADENNRLAGDLDNLKDTLRQLIARRNNSNYPEIVDAIIAIGLAELRYFFKSSNYAFENEYRVIKYYDSGHPLVQIEEGQSLPRPLYIKSAMPVKPFIRKIYMGPKVSHPERWMFLEVALKKNNLNKNVKVIASSCKFQ